MRVSSSHSAPNKHRTKHTSDGSPEAACEMNPAFLHSTIGISPHLPVVGVFCNTKQHKLNTHILDKHNNNSGVYTCIPFSGLYIPFSALYIPFSGLYIPFNGLYIPFSALYIPFSGSYSKFYFREPRRSMTHVGNIFTNKSNVQHLTLTKINN